MHFYLGHHPSLKPPTNFIQGHESVGIIREINGSSPKFKVGDKVAINPLVGCGECFNCLDNQPNICRVSRKVMGFRLDGTMCESLAVGTEQLIKLDARIDMKLAAMIEPLPWAITPFLLSITVIWSIRRSSSPEEELSA
ncbi:Sorbitol dehydrogenase [Raoultella planticola]|uniref:Sorbitol dehydrogenase n=1 Tax=Raoultella planticola TaxID=575 RepID=A0A485D4U4_RAOPL|nr:Sorbitol dehydrogenase [Raoultella planticola]